MKHPEVGDLNLKHEKLAIAGTDGQLMVIYHAEPGSASEAALQLLAATDSGRSAQVAVRDRQGNMTVGDSEAGAEGFGITQHEATPHPT